MGIAREAFQRTAIATVRLRAGFAKEVAKAIGVSPADVLLAVAPKSRMALNFVGPLFWFRVIRLVRSQPRAVLHLLEFKSLFTLRALTLRLMFPARVRLAHSAFGQLSTIAPRANAVAALCWVYFRLVDLVLCQSDEEAARVRALAARFGRAQVAVKILPLAVLDAPPSILAAGFTGQRSGQGRRAIFLGRMVPEKGVLQAIALATELARRGALQELALLGPRQLPDFESAIESASAQASTAGLHCRRAEVNPPESRYDRYMEADVFFMLPTVAEESSLATIEAMVTGCKVLLNENCLIPGLEELPSLVKLVTSQTSPEEVIEWMAAPVDHNDFVKARQRFIEAGKVSFIESLGQL